MHRRETFITVVSMIPAVLAAGPAQASKHCSEEPGYIVGGEVSKTCHFPTSAYLSGGCTATLVHPEIVTTAKHCISRGTMNVSFGENKSNLGQKVDATCKSWSGPGDMGYCKLAKPVTTVPIVPILMGCEVEALSNKGLDIALVGFGRTSGKSKDYGTKRQVLTPIHDGPGSGGGNVKEAEILVGHETKGACNGDSGGPAYIDLRTVEGFKDKPGAGWRVFGVTSRPGPGAKICLGTTVYGMIHKMVDWIERDSGIDITPCFDADGTWKPGEHCKGFPDPEAGGSWDSCDAGKRSGYSHVCGENPNDKGGEKEGDEKEGDESEGDKSEDDEKEDGEEDPSEGSEDESEQDSNKDPDDVSENPDPSTGSENSGEKDAPESKDKPDDSGAKSEVSPEASGAKQAGDDKSGGCRVAGPQAWWGLWAACGALVLGARRRRGESGLSGSGLSESGLSGLDPALESGLSGLDPALEIGLSGLEPALDPALDPRSGAAAWIKDLDQR